MPNRSKTAISRVNEFGKDILSAVDNELFCSVCTLKLDFTRKSSIEQHFKTITHQKNVKKSAKKKAVGQLFLDSNADKIKENLARDLLEAFTCANIPLNKLENDSIKNLFEKYLPTNVPFPSTSLVRKQIPVYYNEIFESIKVDIKNKKVAILCDESTDSQQRYFLQILCKVLDSFSNKAPYLLETIYLEKTNYKTVSQSVLKILAKFEISLDNVYGFVTDNGSYMLKAYNSVLENVLPNSRHITCAAHIIALVADTWRKELPKLDRLVSLIKFMFCKSPIRRSRYKTFLTEMNAGKVILPPEPVLTRWNTWFMAVTYHIDYWSYLTTFVDDEIRLFSETENLKDLLELLKNDELKKEAELVSQNCEKFIILQQKFQGNSVLAPQVFNDFNELYFWLEAKKDDFKDDIKILRLFERSQAKLKFYLFDNGMPSMNLFKSSRFLDPRQFRYFEKDFDKLSMDIPELRDAKEEWLLYLDLIKELNFEVSFDLNQFWLSNKKKFGKLFEISQWLLYYPNNSADCERSISIYNKILTDDRNRLTQESLVYLNFIYFNQKNGLKANDDASLNDTSENDCILIEQD
ncbi:unnamed protein product [Brachionus calyciflorus]|uniref:HAT C-terminal dimerisation domain-containing protein n=1 Tax=Brachionus calyciflorus TaxID=104777 RepID=A0A813TY06_9BILA|nr:unnamed protein product [Brachionus calyciflorus]